jgi:hypothetical protein
MLDNAGACQGPVAMVLAGFVIAGFPLREILFNKKVYAATSKPVSRWRRSRTRYRW